LFNPWQSILIVRDVKPTELNVKLLRFTSIAVENARISLKQNDRLRIVILSDERSARNCQSIVTSTMWQLFSYVRILPIEVPRRIGMRVSSSIFDWNGIFKRLLRCAATFFSNDNRGSIWSLE
jgi:hypothetical protein